MAIALGANAKLYGKVESVYGTAPAGNYARLPFISDNFGSSLAVIESPVLGNGREPVKPSNGTVDVAGAIVVPLDTRAIGVWLKHLLGAPTTTGAGPYTHVFKSGASTLPSLALELAMTDLGVYLMRDGCIVNSMEIGFDAAGTAVPSASIGMIGQGETKAGSSGAGTPTTYSYDPFSQFQGTIKREGTALGNITAGTFNFSNAAEGYRVLGSGQALGGVDIGLPTCSGSLTVRFDSTTLYDDAVAGTGIDLDFIYEISANEKLTIAVTEARLSKTPQSVSGPGGITSQIEWRGYKATGASQMLAITLINDVASY